MYQINSDFFLMFYEGDFSNALNLTQIENSALAAVSAKLVRSCPYNHF